MLPPSHIPDSHGWLVFRQRNNDEKAPASATRTERPINPDPKFSRLRGWFLVRLLFPNLLFRFICDRGNLDEHWLAGWKGAEKREAQTARATGERAGNARKLKTHFRHQQRERFFLARVITAATLFWGTFFFPEMT